MPLLIDKYAPDVDTRNVDEIRRLEELWEASPDEPLRPGVARRLAGALAPPLGPLLALGWAAFVVSVFFEPAPEPNAVVPVWGEFLILGFWLGLAAAGILAITRAGRSAYLAATIAGGIGIALAITCRTNEHHLGSWWIYELAATGALAALGLVGLLRRGRN